MFAANFKNRLLNLLPSRDLEQIEPLAERVSLDCRQVLYDDGSRVDHVYFLESGLASVMASAGDHQIQIGHIGREGMVGCSALQGMSHSWSRVMMQIPGEALRVRVSSLTPVVEDSPEARAVFTLYGEAFGIQVQQTALANGRFSLEQRLARWLLMCHDRTSGDDILITHELLSVMLGVRRAGVTVALHILEGEHAIRSTRGLVKIKDREALERIAGGSYGVSEAAYDRLLRKAPAAQGQRLPNYALS
jgi:CRP-like cAMP-binding protein